MKNKKVLVLAPYLPPWQYYTHFFEILKKEKDTLLENLEIRNNFNISKDSLIKYGGIVLLYHDPLKPLYPEIFHNALKVFQIAEELNIPFINNPLALSNTVKSIQSKIWLDHNIPCAKTWSFDSLDDLLNQDLKFPIFLRYDSGHDTGGDAYSEPVSCIDELKQIYPEIAGKIIKKDHFDKGVAIRWIDTKDLKGIYKKYRAFVFGDEVISGSLISSYDWFIHTHDRIAEKWAVQENKNFMFGEPHNADLMLKATRALGLQINAIDYSVKQDGQLVLWESNPHPAWGAWIDESKEYQTKFITALKNFYKKLINSKGE